MDDELQRTHFREVLVAEALAALDRDSPADDAQEMVVAHGSVAHRDGRIIERAWQLARKRGLLTELRELRKLLLVPVVVCALIVAVTSSAILRAVIGEGRTINVFLALWSVLGLHLAALALWTASFLSSPRGGSGLGRMALKIVDRTVTRDKSALIGAATDMLHRNGMTPWAFGVFSHLVWSGAFVFVIVVLLAAFAFNAFQLTWETTILRPGFFVDFIALAGWLPAKLGFPSAGADLAGALADATVRHRLLAWWLIGCTATYGLLPRLMLLATCVVVWRLKSRGIGLDGSAPWYRRLATRFDRMNSSAVVDGEHASGDGDAATQSRRRSSGIDRVAAVGFELAPELEWPPASIAEHTDSFRRIAGSHEERRAVLDWIAAAHFDRVLLVVDGGASPDRGTGRFLDELDKSDREVAIQLVVSQPSRMNRARWVAWLSDMGRSMIPVLTSPEAAQRWVGGEDA